jgi:hypothetical protein
MMDEDWKVLTTLFPSDWKELAAATGALKGLRKDKSEENLLRTVLIHLGCGYSLRETVVRARQADLADLSDVALLKRLKKCKGWLHALCLSLFAERGAPPERASGRPIRLFDATLIAEPGKTGSLWRVHYSVELPSLRCDYFKLSPTQGKGTGESFQQFPIETGDLILADRGYSLASGIEYVDSKGAFVTVRFNPQNVPIMGPSAQPFNLLSRLKRFKRTGEVRTWPVLVPTAGTHRVPGRICVARKSKEAIRQAHDKLKRRASKNGQKLRAQTLMYAEYVIVFTTFPEDQFSASAVLEWYRIRWQIELVFKRFKQIAQLGHLPKHDDESAQAWLYGKLFIALVTEKLIAHATSISPWGYNMGPPTAPKPVA